MAMLWILAVSLLSTSSEVFGQVSSLCRSNEMFLTCGGCQHTCENPAPACAAICRVGCYCPPDLVRGKDGICIPLSECPGDTHLPYQDTTEPRFNESAACPEHEEYRFCEPCGHRTCDKPEPTMCPAQCARGCFCKDGLVRDRLGKCIKLDQCPKQDSPMEDNEIACADNEEFRTCEPCGNRTCDDPEPTMCPAQCARGCFCKDGLVRDRLGKCIKLEQCPKQANQLKREAHLECSDNQEFSECGCDKVCSDPTRACSGKCEQGCFCKDGFYKSPTGECVPLNNCPTDFCEDENAEYTCRYPCEDFCSWRPCAVRAARCSLGCFCRAGFVKEDSNGKCVLPNDCITPKGTFH